MDSDLDSDLEEMLAQEAAVPEGLKLYHADSMVPASAVPVGAVLGLAGFENVTLRWFVVERESPVAEYGRVIRGYDELDETPRLYVEDYIDSLFTAEELEQLRTYVRRIFYADVSAKEAGLPAPSDMASFGVLPLVRGEGYYDLSETPGYDLPFKVEGYYDLSEYLE